MQVTPTAEPKIRYDITVNGPGDITLNAVRNMDTHEEWDGEDQEAIDLWEAHKARTVLHNLAMAAFETIAFDQGSCERIDVSGVVELRILVDYREEWEDLIQAAFETDGQLTTAQEEERLTVVWVS